MKKILCSLVVLSSFICGSTFAQKVGSVETVFNPIGSNGRIEVEALKDQDVEGVTCHVSYAKAGGLMGDVGLAEEPSKFSIACRQTGQLVLSKNIENQKEIKSFLRSAFFKEMLVTRMFDKENQTIIYLIHSKKMLDGSPFNSISTIPLMSWDGKPVVVK